jgi:hypothetical protein
VLRYRRPLFHEQWLDQVYGVHILDHPFRNRPAVAIDNVAEFPRPKWPT